jgi:uncharacterized membrane protein YbhN (UPF0104 family)
LALKPDKALLLVLKLLVSGALLYAVLSRAGIERVFGLLRGISPLSFALAVLMYVASQLVASMRWGLLLQSGQDGHGRLGLRRLFPLYLLGSFFSRLLPGTVGGDAVKAYYLYKETGQGVQALSSVFMDRYIGYIVLMSMGLAAFPFGLGYFRGSWIEWLLPAIVAGFIILSIVFFGLRLGKRMRLLGDFYGHFHSYRRQKGVMARAALLSVVIQVATVLAVYVLALGLGQRIPLLPFFIFVPIIITLSSLPVSISGVGIREGAFVLLFGSIGVRPDAATALSFAWFLSVTAGGLAGLYEYLRHKKR